MPIPEATNGAVVHAVRSLEEAQQVISQAERLTLGRAAAIGFVKVWVFFANLLLEILRRASFSKRPSSAQVRNIVVYTVGILGDNVVVLPAFGALRKKYPAARITVVTNCQSWSSEIAKGVLGPSFLKDRLITLSQDPVTRSGFGFAITSEELVGLPCDLFVNLSPFGNRGWFGAVIRELMFARLLGARHAVGFRMSTLSRGQLFNDVQYNLVKNEPRRYRDVIAQLELDSRDEDFLTSDQQARRSTLNMLEAAGTDPNNLFVLNPGAKFSAKCWPPERFGQVAKFIAAEYGGSVVVTGTSSESAIANDVVRFSDGRAVSLAGKTTIQELIELLRLSRGCVTNDTGTMHLAAMVGAPTVAIFSLRHCPTHWLPVGDRIVSLFCLPRCRYCYDDFCQTGVCLSCIGTEMVTGKLRELLVSLPHEDASHV